MKNTSIFLASPILLRKFKTFEFLKILCCFSLFECLLLLKNGDSCVVPLRRIYWSLASIFHIPIPFLFYVFGMYIECLWKVSKFRNIHIFGKDVSYIEISEHKINFRVVAVFHLPHKMLSYIHMLGSITCISILCQENYCSHIVDFTSNRNRNIDIHCFQYLINRFYFSHGYIFSFCC